MENETPSPNGWTLDTLERYLSTKIAALDRYCVANFAQGKERVDMALAASDKAIGKAELATEKRFEGVNEFRETLADQAANLIPRAEFQVQHQALLDKVELLSTTILTLQSSQLGKKASITSLGTIVVGSAVVLTGIAAILTLVFYIIFRGH